MNRALNSVDPLGTFSLIEIPNLDEIQQRLKELLQQLSGLRNQLNQAKDCLKAITEAYQLHGQFTNDKYAHCLASCKISKDCSVRTAIALGALKEYRDLLFGLGEWAIRWAIPKAWQEWLHDQTQGGNLTDSLLDFLANIDGYKCRTSPKGCEKCCECVRGPAQ